MMISLRALVLATVAAGLFHIDAQAQTPDGATSLPAANGAVEATPAEGGEPHGGMAISADGATRREILNRLFAELRVEIEWRNEAFADEQVRDRLTGPPAELARLLLARGSYLMVYETGSEEPRLARIIILGSDPPSVTGSAGAPAPSAARQKPPRSEAARRRAAIEAARRAIKAAKRR